MSKITKSAKGEECQLMIFPYCNGNPETTVFCHAPSEDKGTSVKSPDHWGSYGCSTCHDIIDNRMNVSDISNDEIFRCIIRGVFRTQSILITKGLINVNR